MITPAEVARLAALARLDLSEHEVRRLATELAAVLRHVDALRGVEPVPEASAETVPAAARPLPLRPDAEDAEPLHVSLSEIAPAERDGFVLVPRLEAFRPER